MLHSLIGALDLYPYTPGDVIDRLAIGDARTIILCIVPTDVDGDTLDIDIQHTNPGEDFVPMTTDEHTLLIVRPDSGLPMPLVEGAHHKIALNVTGAKQYIKLTPAVSGDATIACCVAIGDTTEYPIE